MNMKRGLGSAFRFQSIKELILKLFCRTKQNITDRELSLFYRSSLWGEKFYWRLNYG